MKKLPLICLLAYTFSVYAEKDFFGFPDYQTILTDFYLNYSLETIPDDNILRFEKRPTGWHITFYNYIEEEISEDFQVWNRKDDKYLSLEIKKAKSKSENSDKLKEKLIEKLTIYKFEKCLFYGYPGWESDVINYYRELDKVNLSIEELHTLALSNSSFASNLLHDNTGLADKKSQFNIPPNQSSLTNDQLIRYRFYRHNAIEYFTKLANAAPNYEIFVGTIQNKLANEYMLAFTDLLVYHSEEEARKELSDKLYSNFMLSSAYNYLVTCDSNAILFTNGDNDTYPLKYLRYFYGIRKDIEIINLNLINSPRYANYYLTSMLSGHAIKPFFDLNEVSSNYISIIYLKETDPNQYFDAEEAINYVKDSNNINYYGNYPYIMLPTNKIIFNFEDFEFKWEINQGHIYRSHLVFMDILLRNQGERPIYFGITNSESNLLFLNDHLSIEGMAYRFDPTKNSNKNSLGKVINKEKLLHKLMHDFKWDGFENARANEKLYCSSYRKLFHYLSEKYIEENKFDSAEWVLNRCLQKIPNNAAYYNSFSLLMVFDFYAMNNIEKGNEMIYTILDNVKNGNNLNTVFKYSYRNNNDDILLSELRRLAISEDQNKIVKEIDKLLLNK